MPAIKKNERDVFKGELKGLEKEKTLVFDGANLPRLHKKEEEKVEALALTKHQQAERRRQRILEKLDEYLKIEPSEPMKHSDKARYMKLTADLEGLISQQKEEKHLHLHTENINSLDERQLRQRLAEIEKGKE